MTKTEIKKELYKQKPTANFLKNEDDAVYYTTLLNGLDITFKIPHQEATFDRQVPAQLLIRWLC